MSEKRRPLTDRQNQILEVLVMMTAKNKRQPSYSELARQLGVKTVEKQLLEIDAKGWITRTGEPRGIEIPQDVWESIIPGYER